MTHAHEGPPGGPFPSSAWSRQALVPAAPSATPAADAPAAGPQAANPPGAAADGTALPRLLSVDEACALFSRSERTLRRWVHRGHLTALRIGGGVFFREADLRRLIDGALRAAVGGGGSAGGTAPAPRDDGPADGR
jgi:excisionase family DNA binding protein